jgi:hypothetical protein
MAAPLLFMAAALIAMVNAVAELLMATVALVFSHGSI